MTTVYYYRVFCTTDNKYEYVWNTSAPTTCPVNTEHTINTSTIAVIKEISENIQKIQEEEVPTGGNFRSECHDLFGATGPGVSTNKDFIWPFPITVLEIKINVEEHHRGDMVGLEVGPDTVIGAITSPITAGATSITVSPTVLQFLMLGYFLSLTDGVNVDRCGRVININKTTATVTFETPTTNSFSHASPTYVRQTVSVLDNFTLGPPWMLSIGDSKIGGAHIPANTTVRTIITNNSNYSKVLNAQIEYLY